MAGKHALTTDTENIPVLRHPATAPAIVTLVTVALVVGLGVLNRSSEPAPRSLATPLANGRTSTSVGDRPGSQASVREVRTQGLVLATWVDIPLVAPALAALPGPAAYTLIPGATVTTPGGDATGASSSPAPGGSTAPSGGSGSATTTAPPPATATTLPAEAPTTEAPATTLAPTTEVPTTVEAPTTVPPPTTDTTVATTSGLLGAVDGLLVEATVLLDAAL
jgi:hypothetical protein